MNRMALLATLALAAGGACLAQPHPLDPLSREEIAATVSLLKSSGKITPASRFPLLVLDEPRKDELSATPPRRAFAIVFERAANRTFEAVVDLRNRSIVSWKQIHGAPEDDGRRSVRGISSYRGDARSAYMRPIEGVVAYVDLTAGKVFKLVDTGVRPLPKENTDLNSQPRQLLKPLAISQPQGASFRLSGHELSWSNWRFRYAVHPREGLVLYAAGFDDHGKLRSILHRASLAEMV